MKTYRNSSDAASSPLVRRTREGSREMVAKNLDLSGEQRQILLYANGRRTVDEVAAHVPALRSNPDLLFDMESAGLLEIFTPDDSLPLPREEVGVRQPSAASPAPSIADGDGDFRALKNQLSSELAAALGAESGPAVERIQAASSEQELRQLLPKLIELVRLYAGGAASERFAAKFSRPL